MYLASGYLASAYPNSDLSAGTLTLIALVMAACLAIWLGGVFLASREPRQRQESKPAVATPDHAAEDRDVEESKTHGIAA
jgi:hypothetical protein